MTISSVSLSLLQQLLLCVLLVQLYNYQFHDQQPLQQLVFQLLGIYADNVGRGQHSVASPALDEDEGGVVQAELHLIKDACPA